MSHAPTPEQVSIIQASMTGQNVAVEALAGTGKTTTLKAVSYAKAAERGLYVAYNRVTADEARASFPANVECRTLHSLAYATVGRRYQHRLNGPRIPPWDAARLLGVTRDLHLNSMTSLKPYQVMQLVSGAIRRFCYSSDQQPGRKHIGVIKGCEDIMDGVRDFFEPLVHKVWEDMLDRDGEHYFTHDVYLKLWALQKPALEYDFIMLDEAQDSNDLTLKLLEHQGSQLILVGDTYQNLYSWRGSSNQLARFEAPHRLSITQSFRFGQPVADEGQKWLDVLGSELQLSGFDAVASTVERCTTPNAILCRTNAGVIEEALDAQERGVSVAVVGGTEEVKKFAKAAIDLQNGKRTNHPDLLAFGSWDDVQDYVQTPDGRDIAVPVRLIDKYGPEEVIKISDGTVPENRAELIVSTAHKSKGRQWSRVRIATDFREPDWDDPEGLSVNAPECMLAYVAVTRAQHVLDRGGLAFIDKLQRELGRQKAKAEVPA